MMKRNVYLLVLAVVTIFIGVSMPELAEPLEHVPAAQMLVQLLLCFMSTGEPASAPSLASMRGLPRYLAYKMLIIPMICWGVTRLIFPEFALAALLLSSSSIAVMAPFMAYLAGGDGAFVVGGVVVSSLILPVTLPFLAGIALFVDGKEVSGLVQSCLNTA
jgi:predicted Na+-dependent transporter